MTSGFLRYLCWFVISLLPDIFYTLNMKNALIFAVVSMVLLISVIGCSWWNPLASKPETNTRPASNQGTRETNTANTAKEKPLDEQAIDTVVGDEKIGVPECDELVESLVAQSENPDEGYMAKAARQFALNKIRESIKKSIEENKNDKVQMAKDCKDFKDQVDKFKTQEESNKQ
jgi:hypothetical protein